MGLAGFVLTFVVSTRSLFLMLNLFQMLRISLSGWHIHVFFTKIDLAKGYWQILVLPEDRPKTAFATHQGLFQFIRMPFGLVSAPAVFARMMRMLHLADLSAENLFDDILVHSASWSEHLHHVRNVLDRLKSYGLTARPSKILAGFQSLEFLGHVVGSGVLGPDESKTEKILQVSTPTTKKQVRSLLGLLSFYRRYVPGFASVAAPLTDLTKEGGRSCRSIHWTPDCALILDAIPLSRDPSLEIMLPRYLKLSTTFSSTSSIKIADCGATELGASWKSTSVFPKLIVSPNCLEASEKLFSMACRSPGL